MAAAAAAVRHVSGCIFNRAAIETLDAAGFDWKLEIDSASNPVMDASIAADIVVRLHMLGTVPAQFEVIPHHGALPRLPAFCINMYLTHGAAAEAGRAAGAAAARGLLRRRGHGGGVSARARVPLRVSY